MKKIPLTKGMVALVDDESYEILCGRKWILQDSGNGILYASSGVWIPARKTTTKLLMHREIMGNPKGMCVDHINGNGLDNQAHNLRLCSKSQNSMNRNANEYKAGTPFKGVWPAPKGRWRSSIRAGGKATFIGIFSTPHEAALAYNEYANLIHGKFARLNEIPDP